MEIFSILFRLFGEKDAERILKIIGIFFQYFGAKYCSVHPVLDIFAEISCQLNWVPID